MNATVRPSRLPDGAHLIISAFGVRVGVHVSGSGQGELAAHLRHTWEWCGVTETSASGTADAAAVVRAMLESDPARVAAAQSEGVIAGTTLLEVSGGLVPAITLAALEACAGNLLMLHAAAVADPNTGATVLLVGASGSGKSTASRALGKHFGYVTDETVALTRDLRILPYPKPVSLFPAGRQWGKEQHAPSQLGLLPPPAHLHLAGIVLLDRSETAPASAELVQLPTLDAVARLGEHVSYLGLLEHPLHHLANAVHTGTGAWIARYNSADSLMPAVRELMKQESRHHTPAWPTAEIHAAPLQSPSLPGSRLARVPCTDLITENDGGVALLGHRLITLSSIGLAILELVGEGTDTLGPLTDALLGRFGPPGEGDAHSMTAKLAEDLVLNGVLQEVTT